MTVTTRGWSRVRSGRGVTYYLVTAAAVAFAAAAPAAGPHRAALALGLALGVGVLAVAVVRPVFALGALLVVLPAQLLLSAWLFHHGVPGSAAHTLGNVKDVLVLGIVVRAVSQRPARALDRLDVLALGYVAVLTLYLVVPSVLNGTLGAATFQQRLLEWRVLGYAAILVIAARRLPIAEAAARRLCRIAVGAGVVIAGCAIFEAVLPDTWNSFMVSTIGVPSYKNQVIGLDVDSRSVITHTVVGGHSFVRSGSVFSNALVAGFVLYVAWTIALTAFSRSRPRPLLVAGAALIGGGILVTVTRSAILGAVVAAFVVLRVVVSERYAGRVRLGLVIAAVVVLAAPLAGSTALGARTTAAVQGSDVSAQRHVESLHNGFSVLVHHPLGQGLGTGPGVGDRFGVANKVTSEDFYLGVADEAGLLAALLFIGLFAALLTALRRESRRRTRVAWLAGSLYSAGCGYAVGALFLHVWLDFTTSLTFFGLAGAVLAAAASARDVEGA